MTISKKLIVVIAICAIAATSGDFHFRFTEPAQEIVYTVQEGDTLWSIAEKHISDNENILEVIYNIKKDNDITSNIYPGQQIIIKYK